MRTWANTCKTRGSPSLDELLESLPDFDSVVAKLEVSDEATLHWLQENMGAPHESLIPPETFGLGIPMSLSDHFKSPGMIVARNAKGLMLKVFFRNEEKLMYLDLEKAREMACDRLMYGKRL